MFLDTVNIHNLKLWYRSWSS